ncbi:MAG: Spy/CpxP family protein refolding chaperone [Thermoanaerobaculia bacterium]
MWWNQEAKIRELELTAAQRQACDRLLRDFLLAESTPPAESYDEMGNHLAKGEAAAARQALEEVARAVATPVRRQGELMIGVVSLLTPAQRQILDRSYPQLLRRPWVRTIRPRRGNDGRADTEAPAN